MSFSSMNEIMASSSSTYPQSSSIDASTNVFSSPHQGHIINTINTDNSNTTLAFQTISLVPTTESVPTTSTGTTDQAIDVTNDDFCNEEIEEQLKAKVPYVFELKVTALENVCKLPNLSIFFRTTDSSQTAETAKTFLRNLKLKYRQAPVIASYIMIFYNLIANITSNSNKFKQSTHEVQIILLESMIPSCILPPALDEILTMVAKVKSYLKGVNLKKRSAKERKKAKALNRICNYVNENTRPQDSIRFNI